MVTTSTLLNIVVAVFTGTMALSVLAANPRRVTNLAFSAFMLLICANFAATEFAFTFPRDSVARENWLQVAFVFLILDPIALLYFASVFPRRNRLHDPFIWGTLFLVTVALLAINILGGYPAARYEFNWNRVLLFSYMALCYALALGGLLVTASREASPVWRPQSYAVVAGLGGALIPRFGIIPSEINLVSGDATVGWTVAALVSATAAGLLYVGARMAGADAKGLRKPYLLALAFASIFVLSWLLAALVRLASGRQAFLEHYFGKYQYAFRWILFSLIVGFSFLRFQVVRFDDRYAKPLSYLLPLGLLTLIAAIGYSIGEEVGTGTVLGFQPVQLVVLVALAAGVPLALRTQPGVHRLIRLPGSDDRLGLYRQVLLESVQHPSPEREQLLAELRQVCHISEEADQTMRKTLGGTSRPELVPGALLSARYRVLEPAGGGATGTVWRAEDERLRRPVALKGLPAGSESPEIVALTRLRHPGVVQVYDLAESSAGPVLVTEWAEGRSLYDRLQRGRPPLTECLALAESLLEAVAAVHAARIIHGDIKPENILLTASGPKLADFGLARVSRGEAATFGAGSLRGTPKYLPPEALMSGRVDEAADLWAVALVVLECLEGSEAFGDPAKSLRRLGRRSPALGPVLARALEREPARRYSTAQDFLSALHGIKSAS